MKMTTFAIVVLLLLGNRNVAFAQQVDPVGPLTLAPVSKKIVFSPDFKVTKVNDQTATMVGGYTGGLIEDTVLVGGGLYWLAEPHDRVEMFYGGLVLGWRAYASDRLGVMVRGLLGAGEAKLFPGPPEFLGTGRHPFALGIQEDFLVAEPEVLVQFGLTNAIRLNVGGGYRLTTGKDNPPSFGDLVNGATGTIGVQFNVGR